MAAKNQIFAARKALNESQAAFARRFGVDQVTIHRWEKYGAPERGPTRFAIEHILKSLKDNGSREAAE